MSVTGPNLISDLNNIQGLGTPQRMGSDLFSAVTDIISGGSDGEGYQCMASNGVSSMTATLELRGYLKHCSIPCEFFLGYIAVVIFECTCL